MKNSLISLLASVLAIGSVNAQEAEPVESSSKALAPLSVSGSIDTYYRTSLTSSKNPIAPITSFANSTGFNIGMVNLIAAKEGEKYGFVADLVFGPRGDDATFSGGQLGIAGANINQLYAYYNLNDRLTITLGNFNTFLGYEVISPVSNFNYSTSYMFSFGPFSHTGAKLDMTLTDNLTAMVGVFNPTDEKTLGANSMTYGAQVGYVNNNFSAWVNYLGGNTGGYTSTTAQYNQIDLTAGLQATDALYLGLNSTYATQISQGDVADGETAALRSQAGDTLITERGFAGLAIYAQYAFNDHLSIGLRGERASSRNNFIGLPEASIDSGNAAQENTKGAVTAFTLSAQYKVGDLTIIPEVRMDKFNKLNESISGSEGTAALDNNKLKNGLSAFSIAAIYAF